KTGTAEKAPRDKSNYIVSFLGFAPTDDPQMIIYVVIDEPDVEDQAHSSYATQLAHEILEEVLPFLGVYPSK
ncbi:MAG: penicillin-binding transpeptidase domain-containing protein, partial [Acetivibrio ethanolgignens]